MRVTWLLPPALLSLLLAGCGASAEMPGDGSGGPVPTYTVGGSVSGLDGNLVLQDNGGDDLTLTADGDFTFATPVADGTSFEVTVKTQPTGQTCTVTGGTGTIAGDDETGVSVACTTNHYAVGGTITGLVGTVVLQNNGGDDLTLTADGAFTFATPLLYGAAYAVTIAHQPAASQCAVSAGGTGMVGAGDVTTVEISCVPLYQIGGSVTGLSGTLVLQDNGGDDLTLTADGMFAFASRLLDGATYAVTVLSAPATQQCTVAPATASGMVAAADVTDVAVTCVNTHTVGGTVTGLAGGTLTLLDNGGDALMVTADGAFTFTGRIAEGNDYAVTVGTQPTGQLCTVTGGIDTMGTADVTTVAVSCRRLLVALDEVHARPATGARGDTNGDGVRDASDDEFVEIYNGDAFDVDVSGWAIRTGTSVRFAFPAASVLAPGQRAVVFGGGTPTGSFGGALAFAAAAGLSLTDAPTSLTVNLESDAVAGIVMDSFTYDASTFGSSCTTTCASQVRDPAGTGAFVDHPTAAGDPGVLWSPGVAPTAAIPKAAPTFSTPAPTATSVSVLTPVLAQFNMAMDAASFDATHLKLYASSCATLTGEVTGLAIGPGTDSSSAQLVPPAPLAYATDHCVVVDGTTPSVLGVTLGTTVMWGFTTRAAASAPAASIVISEVGGCRLTSTTGTNACTGTSTAGNDEFIELYNPTNAAVDVSGWFLQRRSAGGSASCAATLPAGATIPAGGFYLVGGAGYVAAEYAGTPAADFTSAGSLVVGGSESVILISSAGTCTGSSDVVDAVSVGTITDTYAGLALPAFPTTVASGSSIERKACYDSTGDADVTTGMLAGGGHELQGNSEQIGAGNADWVARPTPGPQNTASTAETRSCQ